jgi:hypothetical protein
MLKSNGEHRAADRQVHSGPVTDRFGAEHSYRCELGVDRMASLVQEDGCNDRNLVL